MDKALARAHILEGLRIAIDNIDEVIDIIRNSYDDAKEKLMKRFGLTDIQAQAILDMRLKTLSGLQREKIEEEYKQLMELIAHLRAILGSERLVFDIIKGELIEIRDKFGDERKTKIVASQGEFEDEDLIINYLKTILGVNDYVLGEYNIKSLFDLYFTNNDDNFAYEGYGVDQGTLNLLFFCRNNEDDQEKRDYLIAKYMQKYNMSYEDAYHFLSSIDYETGGVCSYASFCNEVYTSYIGKEEQFKQDFGFDMYRIDKYGNKVLNSEEFLADVILYANLDTNGGKYYYEKDGSIKINKFTNGDQVRLQLCDPKIMDVEFPRNTDAINNYLKSHNENLGYNSNVVSTKNSKKLKI